jgi:hypothetical protein
VGQGLSISNFNLNLVGGIGEPAKINMKKLKKISSQKLVNELILRGNDFSTFYPDGTITGPSNYLEIPFDNILEMTCCDEEFTEEFFDKNFMSVYNSMDWEDVRERAFIYVVDFIILTLRKKFNDSSSYNETVWEVEI